MSGVPSDAVLTSATTPIPSILPPATMPPTPAIVAGVNRVADEQSVLALTVPTPTPAATAAWERATTPEPTLYTPVPATPTPSATPVPPTPTAAPTSTATVTPTATAASRALAITRTPTGDFGTLTGSATPYADSLSGNLMGCGGVYQTTDISVVAVGPAHYSDLPCGALLQICGTSGCINGARKDSCPGCPGNDVDLSRAGFNAVCGAGANSCKVTIRKR